MRPSIHHGPEWRRHLVRTAAALLSALALLGCPGSGDSTANGGEGASGAANARDVFPDGAPRRIVSLAPSLTEAILQVGPEFGSRVVGVTKFDDAPEVTGAAKVGGYMDPSLEAIAALSPDLVVAEDTPPVRPVLRRLEAMGIQVLALPLRNCADVSAAIRRLGAALKMEGAGKAAADRLGQRLGGVSAKARRESGIGSARPTVLAVAGWNPLVAMGKGTFADELIGLAGGINSAEAFAVPYPSFGAEAVASLAPDLILDAAQGEGTGARDRILAAAGTVLGRPLRAVPVSNALLRPGPRLADAAEEIRSAIASLPAQPSLPGHSSTAAAASP